MRTICFVFLLLLVGGDPARAQSPSDLQIRIALHFVSADGGDKSSGGSYINRVAVGKAETTTFSAGTRCDAWAISAKTGLMKGAVSAWRIETTPLRVLGDAVTFRLRWAHVASLQQQMAQLTFDNAVATKPPGQDIELTLRPGESWDVDRVDLPPGSDVHGKPCPLAAVIRASVDVYPGIDEDARLVGAEFWLVERLPNGTEVQRSQPVSVRALPYRSFRFYFDRIVDGGNALDISGIVNAKPSANAMTLAVETRSRWSPEKRNISGPQRFLNSEIQVKPGETVEIRLPALGDEAGVFAKRALSLRVRARQLR